MIHTLQLGVAAPAALDFWAERLEAAGVACERDEVALRFTDYDGLAFELVVAASGNPPLVAIHPEIPSEHALIGLQGARAYGRAAAGPAPLLTDTLGFDALGEGGYRLTGEHRHFEWAYDDPPADAGRQGAGTVHHIAWACPDADQPDWQRRVRDTGVMVTDVRDRDYFRSIYFREPRGVLFEIATLSPGFAVDEDPNHLGESLKLPRMHEHLRPQLERSLTPLVNPRARREAMRS
jgi:glyoxalase family protein